MMPSLVLAPIAQRACCVAFGSLLDGGYLRIYTSDDTLLAEARFDVPACVEAGDGAVARLHADQPAMGTGTVALFRAVQPDGVTVVCAGRAGTTDADLVLSSDLIQAGATIDVFHWTIRMPNSWA